MWQVVLDDSCGFRIDLVQRIPAGGVATCVELNPGQDKRVQGSLVAGFQVSATSSTASIAAYPTGVLAARGDSPRGASLGATLLPENANLQLFLSNSSSRIALSETGQGDQDVEVGHGR